VGSTTRRYGPCTPEVERTFALLSTAKWFSRIGKPLRQTRSILVVRSWTEAIAPFDDGDGAYDISGHLAAPGARCRALMRKAPYRPWFERAVADATDWGICHYDPFAAKALAASSLGPGLADWLDAYLYQFTANLLVEAIGSDVLDFRYFRRMLRWFHEGRLPCGWVGAWPAGRLRVF
jgi:hypothetical protein